MFKDNKNITQNFMEKAISVFSENTIIIWQ